MSLLGFLLFQKLEMQEFLQGGHYYLYHYLYNCSAVAAFAKVNLINTVSNAKYAEMPQWFKNWENTGLLEFDDKNADGVIQYVADTQVNELTIDRDIMVLANPEIANLPAWVIGLIVAGGLCCSTFNSCWSTFGNFNINFTRSFEKEY